MSWHVCFSIVLVILLCCSVRGVMISGSLRVLKIWKEVVEEQGYKYEKLVERLYDMFENRPLESSFQS